MKIGILTTAHAANYGAMLQAYALQKYIKKNICTNVKIIDYFPPYRQRPWKYLRSPQNFKDFLLIFYRMMNLRLYGNLKKRHEALNSFFSQLDRTKTYYTASELETLTGIDTFICGSDQIWNVSMNYDPVNFLSFTSKFDNVKRISYAASVADDIPADRIDDVKKHLQLFDHISVREEADINQIQQLTELKVQHVCDPVFLLDREEWEKNVPSKIIHEPYILCYFLTVSSSAIELINKIKELTGMKVVHVNINNTDKFNSDIVDYAAGPLEFVSYIKNAQFICTNSFHCTAFSILFQKNFIIVGKDNANRRMENLLKQVGLSNRFVRPEIIRCLKDEDLHIDYSIVENKQREWINYSKAYLHTCLQEE